MSYSIKVSPLEVDGVWASDENEARPASVLKLLCIEHFPSRTETACPVLLFQG